MQQKKKICSCCKKETYLYSKKLCLKCYRKEYPEKFQIKKSKKIIKLKSGYSLTNTTPKKPVNRQSQRQIERLKKYRRLRDEYFKQHPICEFVYASGEKCTCTNIDLHHKAGRIGDNLFNHFMSLCRLHHDWTHLHPIEAKERGYII